MFLLVPFLSYQVFIVKKLPFDASKNSSKSRRRRRRFKSRVLGEKKFFFSGAAEFERYFPWVHLSRGWPFFPWKIDKVFFPSKSAEFIQQRPVKDSRVYARFSVFFIIIIIPAVGQSFLRKSDPSFLLSSHRSSFFTYSFLFFLFFSPAFGSLRVVDYVI